MSTILDSDEFKEINRMIKRYLLDYSGLIPFYNLEEVKTLFSEATNGKALQDYVRWASTPNYWEKRQGFQYGVRCMNELRLNYIKKESKCCAGNNDHNTHCCRDIQNEPPTRLQVSKYEYMRLICVWKLY